MIRTSPAADSTSPAVEPQAAETRPTPNPALWTGQPRGLLRSFGRPNPDPRAGRPGSAYTTVTSGGRRDNSCRGAPLRARLCRHRADCRVGGGMIWSPGRVEQFFAHARVPRPGLGARNASGRGALRAFSRAAPRSRRESRSRRRAFGSAYTTVTSAGRRDNSCRGAPLRARLCTYPTRLPDTPPSRPRPTSVMP